MKTREGLRQIVRSCRDLIAGEIALLTQWLEDASLPQTRRGQVQVALTLTNEGVGCPRWRADYVDLLIDALPEEASIKSIPLDVTNAITDCQASLRRRQAVDPRVMPPASFLLAAFAARHNASAAAELAETIYSDALGMVE